MDQKPTNRQYKCKWPNCKKIFKYKSNFTRHYRVHTKDRPHICAVCQKRFGEKVQLRDHFYKHAGEKPLVCEYFGCGKRFIYPCWLRSHRVIHDENGLYDCRRDGCVEWFSTMTAVVEHERIAHGKRRHFKQSDASPSASKQDDNFPSPIQYSSTVLLSNDTVQEADRNGEAHCTTPCTDTQQQDPNADILHYFDLQHKTSADRPLTSGEHTVNQRHTKTQFVDQGDTRQYQNNATHRWNPYVTGNSALDVVSPSSPQHSSVTSSPYTMDFTGQDAASDDALHPAPSCPDQSCRTADGHTNNGQLATMSTSVPDHMHQDSLYSHQQVTRPRYKTAQPQADVVQYQQPQLKDHCRPSSDPNPKHVDVGPSSSDDSMSPSTHHQSSMTFLPGDIISTSQVAAANGPFHFTASYADTDSQTHDYGARIPPDFHLAHDTPIAMPPSHHEHTIFKQPIHAQPVYEAVAMPYQVGYTAEDWNHDISMMPRSVPTDNDVPQVALPSFEMSYFSPVTLASIQSSPGSSSAPSVPIQTPQGVFDPYQMGNQPTDAAVESQPALLQHQQSIQQYTANSLLPVVSQTQHMPTASEDCDTLETLQPMLGTIQYNTNEEMSAYGDELYYGSTAIPDIDLSILDGNMDSRPLVMGEWMGCFQDVLG